jgi:hypothetical protein
MNSSVFKQWSMDPVSEILGTGYMRFVANSGLEGLAKEVGEGVEILAVIAPSPGSGQLRDFIESTKANYQHVSVLEIWNRTMVNTLSRYGFEPFDGKDQFGDPVTGMKWERGQR